MVVPRSEVVELPLKVEEAMRLLISGGVLSPQKPEASPKSKLSPPASVGG